jgi:predicted HTH domain antitoxin
MPSASVGRRRLLFKAEFLNVTLLAQTEMQAMTEVTMHIPESAFSVLHAAPGEFAKEMRIAAAVKWYELGRISQGRAAEIAGLTRARFIDALTTYQVTPFQYTAEELVKELADAD